MKLSVLARDIQTKYYKKKITTEDLLELYKEGYLNTKECHKIISKGGKNGRIW